MKIQDISTLTPEEIKQEMEKARTDKRIHFDFHHRLADESIRDVVMPEMSGSGIIIFFVNSDQSEKINHTKNKYQRPRKIVQPLN